MPPPWSRVDQGAMEIKRYTTFPKAPSLLKPRHKIVLCQNQDTRWKRFIPRNRCNRCILRPQPTSPSVVIYKAVCLEGHMNWALNETQTPTGPSVLFQIQLKITRFRYKSHVGSIECYLNKIITKRYYYEIRFTEYYSVLKILSKKIW